MGRRLALVAAMIGVLAAGNPPSAVTPAGGDDLWHSLDEDLAAVDGVLFDDCVLSWVDGGRTTAADVDIQCTPEP